LLPVHEAALRDFLDDFAAAGEATIPAYFADSAWPHNEIVEVFAKQSRGEGLPEGWVPGTTLFLVDDERILGVANIRHWLTEHLERFGGHVGYSVRPSERCKGYATELLRRVVEYAGETLGIDRLLVTCGAENVASARVIEKCGGVLEDESFHDAAGKKVRRYWIER
jgi:predicted acetyltransferase